MVEGQTLEAIKGGGGSIKIGTTGTINALMSRELKSVKVGSTTSKVPLPDEAATVISPKAKVQADEASSSSSKGDTMSGKNTSVDQKTKQQHHHARRDSRNPFLRSDSVSVDGNGTNDTKKNDKKGSCMVQIVDVKCGVPDKAWANPITNRLKKLGFSKLSDANGVKQT